MVDRLHRWLARPSIRRAILLVAIALLSWSVYLVLGGGFQMTVFGARVSSRDASRPLTLAFALLSLYLIVSRAHLEQRFEWLAGRLRTSAASIVIVVACGAAALSYFRSTHAAGGADSYGYVSQADLWLARQLTIDQPVAKQLALPFNGHAMAPLGYRPGPEPYTIVPVYAPGLPIIMAIAKAALGGCGVYLVVPAATALLIWFTYRFGERVGGRMIGLSAAVLTACSPVALYMSMWPMSDVPVAAAWTAALASSLTTRSRDAALAGIFAAVTVLIRPNLVPLMGVAGLAMAMPLLLKTGNARATGSRVLLFLGTASLGILFVAITNERLYGSPVAAGYGQMDYLFAWAHLAENLQRYPRWIVETQTPVVLLAFLPLLPRRLDAGAKLGAQPAVLIYGTALVVLLSYVFYRPFEEWWFLRYLLPLLPGALIATTVAARAVLGKLFGPAAVAAGLIGALVVAIYGVKVAAARQAFHLREGEQRFVWVGEYVQAHTPANAVIICRQQSGGIRYYGGRLTVRFDWIESIDDIVRRLERAGYKPYILIENWERPEFASRFGNRDVLGRLDWPPVAQLKSAHMVTLYDPSTRHAGLKPDPIRQSSLTCDTGAHRVAP